MTKPKQQDQYSEQEATRRRDETARVLLKTPPHPNWWPTNVRKKAGKSKATKTKHKRQKASAR
jgi:hypothetical protein